MKKNMCQILGKIITKTNGGFDVVIECCGNGAAVTTAMQACKQGGKIVLVGVSLGKFSNIELLKAFGLQIFWILLFNLFGNFVWKKVIKHLIIQGG